MWVCSADIVPPEELPWGEQYVPVGAGVLDKAANQGREHRRGCFVGFTGDVGGGEGRLLLVFSCYARDETRALSLVEQREQKRSEGGQPARCSGSCRLCFSRDCLLE